MSNGSFTPKRLFRELRWEIGKALFIKEFLNSAILFFVLTIPLTLFNMTFWWALIPALVMLTWRMIRGFRKSVVYKIEEGNPEVHEILRTAYDHQKENSLMVQGLMFDLQKKLATVSTGVLIDPKRSIGKIVVIALLTFVPLAITSFAPFLIQQNPLADVDLSGAAAAGERFVLDRLEGAQLNDTVQYGEENVAQLGDEDLDLQLQTGGSQVNFNNEQEAQSKEFSSGTTRGGVDAQAADYDSGGREYDESEIALINEYSCQQRGEC